MVSKREGELWGQLIGAILVFIILIPLLITPGGVLLLFMIPILIFIALSKYVQIKSITPFGVFKSPPQEFQDYQELFSQLDWQEFEDFVAHLFTSMGYTQVRVTSRSGDRGVDVTGTNPHTSETFAAECKKFTSNSVGEKDVRSFVSAADYTYEANEKWFFTTSYYTGPAIDFAKRANVTLVELEDEKGNVVKGTTGLIDLCLRTFSESVPKEGAIGRCIKCSGTLYPEFPLEGTAIRSKKLICSRYPACKVTIPLPTDGSLRLTENKCPHCFRKVLVYRGLNEGGTLMEKQFMCVKCGTLGDTDESVSD